VRLALRRFLGHQLLDDCKDYWQHHSKLASCFTDIRRSVELLSTEDRVEFLGFIEEQTRGLAPASGDSEVWLSLVSCRVEKLTCSGKISGLGKRRGERLDVYLPIDLLSAGVTSI
jgi:hypothetical protein